MRELANVIRLHPIRTVTVIATQAASEGADIPAGINYLCLELSVSRTDGVDKARMILTMREYAVGRRRGGTGRWEEGRRIRVRGLK